jgi:hypothetical protein
MAMRTPGFGLTRILAWSQAAVRRRWRAIRAIRRVIAATEKTVLVPRSPGGNGCHVVLFALACRELGEQLNFFERLVEGGLALGTQGAEFDHAPLDGA